MLKDTYLKREWYYVKLFALFWGFSVIINFIPFTVKCADVDQKKQACNETSSVMTIVNQLL